MQDNIKEEDKRANSKYKPKNQHFKFLGISTKQEN